jgi:hypothetical protein
VVARKSFETPLRPPGRFFSQNAGSNYIN